MPVDQDVDAFFEDMLKEDKKLRAHYTNIEISKKRRAEAAERSTPPIKQPTVLAPQSNNVPFNYPHNSPQELLQAMQRDINALTSETRGTRDEAFNKLQHALLNASIEEKQFLFSHIVQQLLKCLSLDVERHREIAATILLNYVEVVDSDLIADSLSYIIPTLETRLSIPANSTTFKESSEEVRVLDMKTLKTIVGKCSSNLTNFLDDICYILQRAYSDFFAVVKEACETTIELCKLLPSNVVKLFAPTLVKHLKPCFSHQRSNIRECSVKALDQLIMNGAQESLEDLHDTLRALISDSSSVVREAMLATVQNWSFNLYDRYSYFQRLALFLVTALVDDVPRIQHHAKEILEDLGKVYEADNEKEVNEIKVYDADHKLRNYTRISLPEPYSERPGLGTRLFINKHAKFIITALLDDLAFWSAAKRMRAAKTLQVMTLLLERYITQHLSVVLNEYFHSGDESENDILAEIHKAVRLTGYFVEPESYLPLVFNYCKSEYATSPVLLSTVLNILSMLLQGAVPVECNWKQAIELTFSKFSDNYFLIYSEHNAVKLAIMKVARSFAETSAAYIPILPNELSAPIFCITVRLAAQKGVSREVIDESNTVLSLVAKAKQLSSINDLHGIHYAEALQIVLQDFNSWDKTSPNLYSFEALIKNGEQTPSSYLNILMPVFKKHLDVNNKDLNVTAVIFAAFNQLLANVATSPDLYDYIDTILELIQQNSIWKVGPIRLQLRKASMACMSTIMRQGVVQPNHQKQIAYICEHMFTHLVSNIDESDDTQTRIITIKMFNDLLPLIHQYLFDDKWVSMITAIVERLDDVNEQVRIEACQVLSKALQLMPTFNTTKEFDLISTSLRALMVHLDDDKSSVRSAVFGCLSMLLNLSLAHQESVKSRWIIGVTKEQVLQKRPLVRNCHMEMKWISDVTSSINFS